MTRKIPCDLSLATLDLHLLTTLVTMCKLNNCVKDNENWMHRNVEEKEELHMIILLVMLVNVGNFLQKGSHDKYGSNMRVLTREWGGIAMRDCP